MLLHRVAPKSKISTLKWSDINFEASAININETLTSGLNNKFIMQATKTINGRRIIDMNSESLKTPNKWKVCQTQYLLL